MVITDKSTLAWAMFRYFNGRPVVVCDGWGCGVARRARSGEGSQSVWLEGVTPELWERTSVDGKRVDLCPPCSAAKARAALWVGGK